MIKSLDWNQIIQVLFEKIVTSRDDSGIKDVYYNTCFFSEMKRVPSISFWLISDFDALKQVLERISDVVV